MIFNKDKCVTLHIGSSNQKVNYRLNKNILKKNYLVKDLDVFISHDLKTIYTYFHIGIQIK